MATLAEQIKALNLPSMTEDDLAHFAGLTVSQWKKYKPDFTPEERETCEQMRGVEMLCPLWQSGVEPYPSDVSVNRALSRRKRANPQADAGRDGDV